MTTHEKLQRLKEMERAAQEGGGVERVKAQR